MCSFCGHFRFSFKKLELVFNVQIDIIWGHYHILSRKESAFVVANYMDHHDF